MDREIEPRNEMYGFVEALTAIREKLTFANNHPQAGSILDREEKHAQELVAFLRLIQKLRQTIVIC